tara:strand:+ start:15 stop:218 length:204 start_codon:yes stop_codon:yes gene_type:complete
MKDKIISITDHIEIKEDGNHAGFANKLLTYKGKPVSRQLLRDWQDRAKAPLFVVDGKVVRLVAEIIK